MGFSSDVRLPLLVAAVRIRSWVTLRVGRRRRRKRESYQSGRAEDRSAKLRSLAYARPPSAPYRDQNSASSRNSLSAARPLPLFARSFWCSDSVSVLPPKAAAAVADRRGSFGPLGDIRENFLPNFLHGPPRPQPTFLDGPLPVSLPFQKSSDRSPSPCWRQNYRIARR
jgi:hypothetical protein